MDGKLYYPNGSVRFVGQYEYHEDGTEKYIEGRLYQENGKIWMEGFFQRGGLYIGRQYYPSGGLMFEGQYNNRETGSYYGPPYPLVGKLYDEEGNIIYDGRIPRTTKGSLGWPYIRMPNGSTMPVNGIPGNHKDWDRR